MILHYLAVALAKFRKTPFTTAANVLTLALGLACFIAAYGITSWWKAADSHHANAARIVVIGQTVSSSGENPDRFNAGSSHTIARYLRTDMPDVPLIARWQQARGMGVVAGDAKTALDAAFVEPDFVRIFDFEFLEGSAATALEQPGSVVLTASAAQRLFGDVPALGQSVLVDDSWEGTVTGVIAEPRQPSFLGVGNEAWLEMLASMASNPVAATFDSEDFWTRSDVTTFAVLPAEVSADAFNARLAALLERRAPPEVLASSTIRWKAHPIRELTTRQLDSQLFAQSGLDLPVTTVLLGLGLLTLVVACVNYANLAIAQTASRTKDVGMRKVLGAGRSQVMAQAGLEALVLAAAALAVALVALALARPAVLTWANVDLLFFLKDGLSAVALIAGLAVAAGLLAGVYPALVLSGVRPAQALQSGRSRGGPRAVMRLLVGVQFASASFLLILVVVAGLQRSHVETIALASREDPVIVLNNMSRLTVDEDVLADRLSLAPGVDAVSYSDREPWAASRLVFTFARSADAATTAPPAYMKVVTPGYFETLDLGVLAGRVFDPARETAPSDFFGDDPAVDRLMVIDHALAARLGFETPEAAVDQIVYIPAEEGLPAFPVRIIGVTETEASRLEASGVGGHGYVYAPWRAGSSHFPMIRIARDDVAGAIAGVTEVWDEMVPNAPIAVRFMDDLFRRSFSTYALASEIFMLLAGSAFLIATIGQIGMAVHVASKRRHEIGVRKTLGASVAGIIRLLLIDFSKPVLIANLLAWPLGYFAAQAYLSAFADRVSLTAAPFLFSMALTLAIAWAAVIGEVLKAASVRPAEVLRHA